MGAYICFVVGTSLHVSEERDEGSFDRNRIDIRWKIWREL